MVKPGDVVTVDFPGALGIKRRPGGLEALSQKYRERLAKEGKLDQRADEVMAELKQIREEVATHDYRT